MAIILELFYYTTLLYYPHILINHKQLSGMTNDYKKIHVLQMGPWVLQWRILAATKVEKPIVLDLSAKL